MRLGRTLLALTLTAGIGLSLATTASAHSRAALLERFQPALFFHEDEPFRPIRVESFVRDSDLEVATSPTTWVLVDPDPTVDTLPVTSPPVWRLNQRDCFAGAPLGDLPCYVAAAGDQSRGKIYGRIARDGDAVILQYWLFYYDDLYSYPFLPPGTIWQSHEGDWEVVNVVLAPQEAGRRRLQPALLRRGPLVGRHTPLEGTPEGVRGARVARQLLRARTAHVRPGLPPGPGARLLPAGRSPTPGGRRDRRRSRGGPGRAPVEAPPAELARLSRLLGRAPVLQRASPGGDRSLRNLAAGARVPPRLVATGRDAGHLALTGAGAPGKLGA